MFRLRFALFLVLLAGTVSLHAQIMVNFRTSRRLFIAYEPVVATVSITNLAGRDITLQDSGSEKWFSFQILNHDESPVPARNLNYQLEPLTIPAGKTVERKVDLNTLYPVNDYGLYRIRASIFFADAQKYFSSQPQTIDISEGKMLWQQTVGVPEGQEGAGGNRLVTVMTFRLPKSNQLYVRIEDKEAGVVYCTHQIGRILAEEPPQIQLDQQNQLHLLQLTGPRAYLYTRVGLNGEVIEQTSYDELKTRPRLKRIANGNITVAGGQAEELASLPDAPRPAGPKLSDRPPGLPTN